MNEGSAADEAGLHFGPENNQKLVFMTREAEGAEWLPQSGEKHFITRYAN